MPFAPETIALSGSGLVFNNTYTANVSAAYRTAIIAAENFYQQHFTNSVTLNMSFDFRSLGPGVAAQNSWFAGAVVSYASLVSALTSHAATPDDFAALASLPTTDPSGGKGFVLAAGMARILGLAGSGTGGFDDKVTLNSDLPFTFGQDGLGAIEHEISEGAMGRVGGLGVQLNGGWGPMDLFRYTASGQHDFTDGRDGQATFFSVDGRTILTAFHNSQTPGRADGGDVADWNNTLGDAFGPGGPSAPGLVSATDLRVMDILGWTPTGSSPFVPPAADDFANSVGDVTHPFGQVATNGSATGSIESAGDRDWFRIQLSAGTRYIFDLQGQHAGAGTLQDPFLALYDASGREITFDDDIVTFTNPDSEIPFTAGSSGTYYLEASAFGGRATGTYKISVAAVAIPDDFANSLSDFLHPFGQLSAAGTGSGTIESAGDRDWFKIQLTAGTSYTINLQGQHAGAGTLLDPYLRVHDSTGALVTQNDDTVEGINLDSLLSFTAAATGTYYLEAGAYDDQFTGTYKLSVTAAATDDFANSLLDTAHPFGQVAANGSALGVLETAGDRDWFRVQLTAGTTYGINLQGLHAGAGTLEDPYLRLYDANGQLKAQNDDIVLGVNRDSQLTFIPSTSGTYYFEAGAFNDQYTGTYKLSLAIGPAVSRNTAPGRAPETGFDVNYYLAQNPDVAARHMDAQAHYDTVGWKEGRNPNALFDTNYYLSHNPDVARAGIDPLLHFETSGWREGRDPGPSFSVSSYLQHNPDVAAIGLNPLDHYLLFGIAEGRSL